MRKQVVTCHPDDSVEEVREILQAGRVRALAVIDDNKNVVGIISRTNLLRQVRTKVVLVDHNERGQSVAGIEDADIVGVIDHHRVADFQTRTPPFMRLEPVGATSTIVAKLFTEAGIPIPPSVAGALLSGILADTLLFRGPTATDEDRRVAKMLAERAEVDIDELGSTILSLASDLSDRSPTDIVMADFKDFRAEDQLIGIGTFETASDDKVMARRAEILEAMSRVREKGYASVLFAIIDILKERTTILISGNAQAVAETFSADLKDDNTITLPGILSRKKNIVPLLPDLVQHIDAGSR